MSNWLLWGLSAAASYGLYYLSSRCRNPIPNTQVPPTGGLNRRGTRKNRRGVGIANMAFNQGPNITNLDGLLHDIYVRFVALKDDDFRLYQRVFRGLFDQLEEMMRQVDPYYKKYSSRKQCAGSMYDGLRIKKPDEFDMDLVIGLPVDFDENRSDSTSSDITFEPTMAAFTQLRMGKQFQRLPVRDGAEWQVNKTAYEWKDDKDYLLCNKFVDWFKSVVVRALNGLGHRVVVDGVAYDISRSESGPAITIIATNARGFRLDVDFVPTLKFPETRWPISRAYRNIPNGCHTGDWMLVPKPNKAAQTAQDRQRSWRIALHYQERNIIRSCENLKQTIRLMKKLRDSLNMHAIASYYIKTLFLWEMGYHERSFWRSPPSELFTLMVTRLRDAVASGTIPYYWNKNNNLIAAVPKTTLQQYRAVLDRLVRVLETPQEYRKVAEFLLTGEEYLVYKTRLCAI